MSEHYGGRGPAAGGNNNDEGPPPEQDSVNAGGSEFEASGAAPTTEGETGDDGLGTMAGGGSGGGGTLVASSISPLPPGAGFDGGVGVGGAPGEEFFMGGGGPADFAGTAAFYGQQPPPQKLAPDETASGSEDIPLGEGGMPLPQDRDAPGPLKLFVGQVPKNMNEEDLFPTFADFGPIKELMIIRDKHTGQHRGCAFITFWAANDALSVQEALHDQLTLPGGRKPLQIRPATESGRDATVNSSEQENKLFVGMTSRNADENSLKELFAPFGEIKEIYIIRHADGSNKGCAFLKFVQRESALSAIEALNDKIVMEGATRPLIVKFADTKAQRRARRGGRGHGDHPGGGNPYYMQHPSGPPVPVYPNFAGQQGPPMPMPPQYPQQFSHASYPGVSPGGTPPPPHNYMYPVPRHPHSNPYGYPPAGHFPPPHGATPGPPSEGSDPYDSSGGGQHGGNMPPMPARRGGPEGAGGYGGVNPQGGYTGSGGANPRPREGPTGANLFIYHLPHDLTDADLATAFNPFGNVISAKVYVDKYTGESKGFGFVSYDSVPAAEAAIEQMNGFQIGSKRLKVQHKRVTHRRQDSYEGPPAGMAGMAQGLPPPEGMPMQMPPQHDAPLMGIMPPPQGQAPRQQYQSLDDTEEQQQG